MTARSPHGRAAWLLAAALLAAGLAATLAAPARAAGPVYTVGPDTHGQQTITVTGSGSTVTLPQVRAGLGAQADLVADLGGGVYQLNANLVIEQGVQLTLAAPVTELRMRSQPSAPGASGIDYASFVSLRAEDGTLVIDGVSVRSWDPAAQAPDTDADNGRAYLLAKGAARMDINSSDLGYLGSGDGESYGVSWRDYLISGGQPSTRVTGSIIGSSFHHNYYGVYTFQAASMTFRGNTFHDNIHYGFDPHDYSHDFIVEDNQAYANGSHGFIISRGCYGFAFRRNVSHDNSDPDPVKLAHGFMLDPGSPNSSDPQAPSTANLFEGNHAYGNEGYGLRILGSTSNTVRGNLFEGNQQGITIEQGSTGNLIEGNTVRGNAVNGIFVRGGGDGTTISGNDVSSNAVNGIYVKANGATVAGNTSSANGQAGLMLLPETTEAAALADLSRPGVHLTAAQIDPELVGKVVAGTVDGTVVNANTLRANGDDGATVKGATNTHIEGNVVDQNRGNGIYFANGAHDNLALKNQVNDNWGTGIRANGADTLRNVWSQNSVFANGQGGIAATSGANGGIAPPVITSVTDTTMTGTAPPGATVEVFSDDVWQGRIYEGSAVAGADGAFTLTVSPGWHAYGHNATATLASLGSSSFDIVRPEPHSVLLPLVVR